MKKLTFLFLLLLNFNAKAQENCYLVIPKQFSFQKSENQHRINSLSKHLLTEQGFRVIWSDELQETSGINPKNIIRVDLENRSNLMVTKVKFIFKDALGKEIFTTKEGKSRQKEFAKAFNEAIKWALNDLRGGFKPQCEGENESLQPENSNPTPPETISESIKTLRAVYINEDIYLFDGEQKAFLLEKTPAPNTFKATDQHENQGILYPKGDFYLFEYKQNDQIIRSNFKILW